MTYVKCMALMFKGTSLKQQAFPPTSYGHYDTAASVGFVLSDSVAHSIVCFNKVVLSSWSQRMWQVLWGGARGYGVGAKGYGNHESILSFPGTGVLSISHSHSAFRIPHSSFPIPHSPFLDPHYPFPSPKSPIPVPVTVAWQLNLINDKIPVLGLDIVERQVVLVVVCSRKNLSKRKNWILYTMFQNCVSEKTFLQNCIF